MNFIDGVLEGDGPGLRFVGAEAPVRLALGTEDSETLADWRDKPITLGVRPENLQLTGASPPMQHTLAVRIDVVEPLGADLLVHGRCGGVSMIARVGSEYAPEVGTEQHFELDLAKLHFFDPLTQRAIGQRRAE
jgi:multiple sugar transport system ATP-binding protein